MISTVNDPCRQALDRDFSRLEDSLAQAESGHGSEVLVTILGGRITADDSDDVLRQELALPHRMLCVRHAVSADAIAGDVGNRGHIARTPGAFDRTVLADDAHIGADAQAPALFRRQVGHLQHRVGHDASGPHDEVGLEALTRRHLDLAPHRRPKLRIEMHFCASLGEILEHPVARLERHFGHYPTHRLDEVELGVIEGEVGVVTQE